ncbi:MAG: hypothetical protein LBO62_07055 [Endomicrobium sp.]|jgi:hypothetical protein|nr:hypothetical protein [Endomicrobium sp.]
MKRKFLAVFTAVIMSALPIFSDKGFAQEEDFFVQQSLVGLWQITNARNSVKQIFDFTLYDEYKNSGFVFAKTAKNYSKQSVGRNAFQSYSQIELRSDGTFNAIAAVFDTTSGLKAAINSKTYSGIWKASQDVLKLSYLDNPDGEIISDDFETLQSFTLEFSYINENSELTLFPIFDKENAYLLLEKYLKNPSRLPSARGIFYGILSNSQSSLGAYSVRRLLEAIDQINANPASTTKNVRFIKNIIEQWSKGQIGLKVEKVPKRQISKKAVLGRWYYESERSDEFMNIITPVMPCDVLEIILEPKRGYKQESYSELALRADGSAFMSSFFTNANNTEETYTVELEGVWELERNVVSMKFNKLKHIDSGKITVQDANLFYSFKAAASLGGRLVISKNMPSAAGYVKIKEYVKNARTTQQYFPFEAIPDILNDKYSSLSAYDILRMKQLISVINEHMPEKKMEIVEKACDEMDEIVNKWYDEYVRYNK